MMAWFSEGVRGMSTKKHRSGNSNRADRPLKRTVRQKKMSAIIKRMASWLLRNTRTFPTDAAAEAAVRLAAAAWNDACGDPTLRRNHRKELEKIDWGGTAPMADFRSRDTEALIEELVAYKRAHYPEDRRIIAAAYITAKSTVRVEWFDPVEVIEKTFGALGAASTATAAPASMSSPEGTVVGSDDRRPIADDLLAKMKKKLPPRSSISAK